MKFTLSKPPLLQTGTYLVVNCKANHGFIMGDLTLAILFAGLVQIVSCHSIDQLLSGDC